MAVDATKNSKFSMTKECFALLFCIVLVVVSLWGIWQQLHGKHGLTMPEYVRNWVVALMTSIGGQSWGWDR